MSVQCSVYCAVSLDGFIARPDGRLDWLMGADPDGAPPPAEFGFDAFMESIDWVVLGRNTFDVMLAMTRDQWFYRKPVYVLTHQPVALPPLLEGKVEWGAHRPADLVALLEKRGAKRLYIDGGRTIQSFLAANLIDDLTITQIPILIGQGRPLFGALPKDISLTIETSRHHTVGAIQTLYRVKRGEPAKS